MNDTQGTQKATTWPDLSKDRKAIDQANRELGTGADIHKVLARAQEIKNTL